MMVSHPLSREEGRTHVVASYRDGREIGVRRIRTPLRPILSYATDPLVPLSLPRVDAWFGFNPLACSRGLVQRRVGRAGKVVLWSVDFTPDRFGAGTPLTRVYDTLDRVCCSRADGRIELSAEARDARNLKLGLAATGPPVHIVPMGAWIDRVPTVGARGLRAPPDRVPRAPDTAPGRGRRCSTQ